LHRGYLHQDGGLLLQPFFTVGCNWSAPEGFLVTPYATAWNSFQLDGRATTNPDSGSHAAERTALFVPVNLQRFFGSSPFPTGPTDDWYQGDFAVGVVTRWHDVLLDLTFHAYGYPTGPFFGIEEFGGRLRYDVLSLWRAPQTEPTMALKPSVALYREILNRYDRDGTYLELGLEPSGRLALGNYKVGLSLPTILGMSLADYYVNDRGGNAFFGYASTGLLVSVPLLLPAKYGTWYLDGSFRYYRLVADNLQSINHGADVFMGSVGISFSF
jgi:hypothetical protein